MSLPVADYFSSVASGYADYRPSYPASLFEWLAQETPEHDLAWDCACGSGQASRDLAKHFKRVIATDASEAQIKEASHATNINYRVATAEESGLADQSIDLVTVATALHWFDFEKFFAEVKRVTKPGGLFAAWCYGFLVMADDDLANAIVEHFYRNTIHSYWPSQRHYVDQGYRNIPLFPFNEIAAPQFVMETSWSLPELLGYLRTWSSVVQFKKIKGYDPVTELEKELSTVWNHPATRRSVKWPLSMRAGRVEIHNE